MTSELVSGADGSGPGLAARIDERRNGVLPRACGFIAGRPGLGDEARAWQVELAPARDAIPGRVDELVGPRRRLARYRRLLVVFAVLFAEGLRVGFFEFPRSLLTRRPLAPAAAHRLRRAFEHLGPSYVKFGQFIASGEGLFPDVLVEEFAHSRDRCPQVPWRRIRRAIEADLGPIGDHFAHVDPEPLAAASIAQVHAAVLHDGTPVVVKVRRPGIARAVTAHIRSMPVIARLIDQSFPDGPVADPERVVRLFATTILEELDFRLEAQNMVDLGCDLEAAGVVDVVVPRPVPDLVTERVLVMERIEGTRFADLEEMRAAGIDTAHLLRIGLGALLEGATVFGRFHGDLHAGNVISLPDGRFGLVDFGICARLAPHERLGLRRLLLGVAIGDAAQQVAGLDDLGALPDELDRRRLWARLLAARALGRDPLALDDLREGVPQVMRVFGELDLELPPGLVLFLKDVLYLAGAARRVAPDVDLQGLFVETYRRVGDKHGAAPVTDVERYGPLITDGEVAAARADLRRTRGRTGADDGGDSLAPPSPLRLVRDRVGNRVLTDAIVPVALFVAVNGRAGLAWAIAAVTAWSFVLVGRRIQQGRAIGVLLPFVVGAILVRGLAGIVTRSEAVYFGPAMFTGFTVGLAFLVSAALRVPLVGLIAQALRPFPRPVRQHPTFHRVFTRLTVAWGVFLTSNIVFQGVLFFLVSTNTFVTVRAVVSWTVGIGLFVFSVRYATRSFLRDDEIVELILTDALEDVEA